MAHERFEPGGFGPEHCATQGRQLVIPPPLIRSIGLGDETELDEPRDGGVERAGAESQVASGPAIDVLNDAVSVPVPVDEREEDVELVRGERQKP